MQQHDRSVLERLLIAVTECELQCRYPAIADGASARPFAEYCARLRTRFVAELALRLLSEGEDPDQIMRGALASSAHLSPKDPPGDSWPMRALARAHEGLLWVYERALAEPSAPEVQAAIRWQYGALREAVDRLHVLEFDTA
jgi:hypothetical protein